MPSTTKRLRLSERFFANNDEERDLRRGCAEYLIDVAPYATGYVYVKNVANRDAVIGDATSQANLVIESFIEMVETMDWITNESIEAVIKKSLSLFHLKK